MVQLRRQGQREAARVWRQVRPDDLDGTFELGLLTLAVTTLQREAARLSSAYLSAFVASELGEPERPPPLTVWDKAFGGGDLAESLRSGIVKAKILIADGMTPREATRKGRPILIGNVGLAIDTAARESLRQGMEADERIIGYNRAIKGTCGACAGSTTYEAFSPNAPVIPLGVHVNCVCVSEPVLTGVPDRFPRPTGDQVFASLSSEKQDEMLGPAAAEKVRQGEATLSDFVMEEGGFIKQKPASDV